MDQLSKPEMLGGLRRLLNDVFQLRRDGAPYARLARAHGYVDGYMRVLMETGVATRQELLALVAAERVRADGPATTVVVSDESAASEPRAEEVAA